MRHGGAEHVDCSVSTTSLKHKREGSTGHTYGLLSQLTQQFLQVMYSIPRYTRGWFLPEDVGR